MTPRITLVTRTLRLLPLAALIAAGGCFATRNDVRVLQADLANVRTEMLKADAESRNQLAQALRALAVSNDSIREMSNRLTAIGGDVRGSLRNVNEQLLLVQQLLKQNEAVIDRIRRENERLAMTAPVAPIAMTPPLTAADSAAAQAAATAPQMTAGQLYTTGQTNLSRGSWSTARTAFQELLDTYPTSPDAPGAQLGIARAFEGERNASATITAYQAVIQKYPESMASATARYKLAMIYVGQSKKNEAIALLQVIVDKFPTSNEIDLAKSQLEALKRPQH